MFDHFMKMPRSNFAFLDWSTHSEQKKGHKAKVRADKERRRKHQKRFAYRTKRRR